MNPFAHLLGRHVSAVYVESETQQAMKFDVGYRDQVYVGTYGDCCSETWFADVVGTQALIGGTVRGIEILDLPVPQDGRSRQEEDEAYGVRLTTDKGYCDIVYRNSSNGYYGGSAEEMRKEQGELLSWSQISDDWSAS